MKSKLFPLSMTMLWGVTFSSALHNWAIGMCLGIVMGGAFGLFGEERDDD